VTAIRIPEDLWDTEKVPEGAVSAWLFDDGEEVEEGATVATVMAEKTEYDVPAPVGGILRITVKAEEAVAPGAVIGEVE
jgi:pyruvate/2-oxoglutarate dehydrogenase complex dihydrolipoamide acyltransferase (E2) component